MKKNHEIKIKCNEEEYKIIKDKAVALGLAVSTFLRVLGLNANIPAPKYP